MWILLLVVAIAGGAAAVRIFDRESSALACLCDGAAVGLALLGLLGFVAASFLGLGPLTIGLAAVGVALPLAFVVRGGPHLRLRRLVPLVLCSGLLYPVFGREILETPAGIATGVEHNLGDLPFHIAIVTSFTVGENFPPEHPELAGTRLTYPFIVDFVAAMLVRAGASLGEALRSEALILAVALVALLYRFGLRLTRNPTAAWLTPVLLLVNGGLGFAMLAAEWKHTPLLALLTHLRHDYTITRTGEWRWGNVITTLLIPQRSLLLGAPLAVTILTLWWRALAESDLARRRRLMWGAGALAGLLPLVHAHSFVVVVAMGACLAFITRRPGAWTPFFVPLAVLGLPPIVWLLRGAALRGASFVGWEPGWDHGTQNALFFWFTNAGPFIVLLALGFRSAPRRLAAFTAPFLLCFVVPNLLRLSPWIWDNVKFLFYWQLACVPVVALWVVRQWRTRRWLAACCLVLLTLSGGIDLWRVASRQIELRIFDADGVRFAADILGTLPRRALVLHQATYDSPVYLSGRRSLLGYPGHIPSQGLDPGSREEEIARIYAGAPDAVELLDRYRVDAIVVGPQERSGLKVNEEFLSRYRVAGETGQYRLYRVR